MSKKINSLLSLILLSGTLMAQTSKIAHRSHSGASNSYKINAGYNFGIPSGHYEPFYKTEPVKPTRQYKSKTVKKVTYVQSKHPEAKKVQKDSTVKTR